MVNYFCHFLAFLFGVFCVNILNLHIMLHDDVMAVAGNVPSISIVGGTPAALGEFPFMVN
jgi:hypothetical protein